MGELLIEILNPVDYAYHRPLLRYRIVAEKGHLLAMRRRDSHVKARHRRGHMAGRAKA
jgi:hypothetical protein